MSRRPLPPFQKSMQHVWHLVPLCTCYRHFSMLHPGFAEKPASQLAVCTTMCGSALPPFGYPRTGLALFGETLKNPEGMLAPRAGQLVQAGG